MVTLINVCNIWFAATHVKSHVTDSSTNMSFYKLLLPLFKTRCERGWNWNNDATFLSLLFPSKAAVNYSVGPKTIIEMLKIHVERNYSRRAMSREQLPI
jgi:hypothetical protein